MHSSVCNIQHVCALCHLCSVTVFFGNFPWRVLKHCGKVMLDKIIKIHLFNCNKWLYYPASCCLCLYQKARNYLIFFWQSRSFYCIVDKLTYRLWFFTRRYWCGISSDDYIASCKRWLTLGTKLWKSAEPEMQFLPEKPSLDRIHCSNLWPSRSNSSTGAFSTYKRGGQYRQWLPYLWRC